MFIRKLAVGLACLLALCLLAAPCRAEKADPAPPDPIPTPVPVEKITVSTQTGESFVLVGDELQMLAEVSPENAAEKGVIWSVDDEKIALIDETGLLSAKAVGKVTARASAKDESGVYGEMEIEVRPVLVEEIIVAPGEKLLMKGGKWPLRVSVLPENATDPEIEWISSDSQIARVEADDAGNYFCVAGDGVDTSLPEPLRSATLTARALDESGVTAQCSVTVCVPVSDILVGVKDAQEPIDRIVCGETLNLSAQVLPADASRELLWHSDNPEIATVSASGGEAKLTGVGGGDVVVHATAQDGSGVAGAFSVFVRVPVESVALPEKATLFEGRTLTLTPAFAPENTTDRVVRWSSSDADIATVDAQGTVHGLALGTVCILARSSVDSGIMGECILTVARPVTTILLSASDTVLGVGGTTQVDAAVSPLNASDRSLHWISNNPEVASVTQSGLVTGLKKGSAAIQAIAGDESGAVGVISIEVRDALEELSLPQEMSVMPGESFQLVLTVAPHGLFPGKITWESTDETIARVNNDGLVTGVAAGQSIVRAVSQTGLTAQCLVKVSQTLSSIDLYTPEGVLHASQTLEIDAGDTQTVAASARPAGVRVDISYASANAQIASVSQDGIVSAHRVGQTSITVTARLRDGDRQVSRAFKVRVIQPVTSVSLPEHIHILRGKTASVSATLAPKDATYRQLTWITLNPTVAAVSDSGLVTGVGVGSTLLTAISHNRLVAKCTITVAEPAFSIVIDDSNVPEYVNPGDEVRLSASIKPESAGQSVLWKSSNTKIASVGADGLVRARKTGTVRITALAADGGGASATIRLSILPEVKSLKLDRSKLSLCTNGPGSKLPRMARVLAKIKPSSAARRPVLWSSQNDKIASVDQRGNVTALSDGVTTISALTQNNRAATLVVWVYTLPGQISLKQEELTLVVGQAADLGGGLLTDGSDPQRTWKSNKPAIVKVSQEGVVTARKAGRATVTVRTRNGLSASCVIQVIRPDQATPAPEPAPSPDPSPTPEPASTPTPEPASTPTPEPAPEA